MRPLRVTFVVDAPYAGGAERTVELLARALTERGHIVSVLARAVASASLAAWKERVRGAGVEVHETAMRLPWRPLDARGILRALRALRPDVVHVNVPGPYDGQMGLAAPLARLAGARAVVTTEHLPMVERLWKRALVKRLGIPWMDRVITVSRAAVPFVVERQGVRVVPNALPADWGAPASARARVRAEHGWAEADVVFAFVGSIEARKRPGDVVDALARVEDPRARLVVVGDGPGAARLRERVGKAGCADRVHLAGRLEPDAVAACLAAADALVLPSSVEGFPYVVLEAMASGRAVVATRVFGIVEQVDDGRTGLLVEPGDVEALAAAMARLVRDPDERRAMGRAGQQRFRREFTLERHVERVLTVYAEALGRRVSQRREAAA